MGKLSIKDIKNLLACIKKDPKVVVSPRFGFDAGVHALDDDKYLVISTDPCIGVPDEWFGWLLINYVASDIALFGANMEFCSINLLGSPTTRYSVFDKIMKQTCSAAEEIGTKIITGHTARYNGISTVVGVCTGYGYIHKKDLKTPGDAKPEDLIFCIKPIGLETVVNFALNQKNLAERFFGVNRTKELAKLVLLQSCAKEALLLSKIIGVHALHDTTEGGLTAGLNELAEASNLGFKVDWEQILFPEEVYILKNVYNLSDNQMLSLSSTGTFLAAVSAKAKKEVKSVFDQMDVEIRCIGSFTEHHKRILFKNRKKTPFPREADDPYSRIVTGKKHNF